ncbi:hypothetical protein, partial [Burkholderia gladioli]|uniref:hypothetical protein n=1 Tax=Burkholderia gladioli TaxID=28095 RepID=UPI001ABAC06D
MLRDIEYGRALPARLRISDKNPVKVYVLYGPMAPRELEVMRHIEIDPVRENRAVQEGRDIHIEGVFDGNFPAGKPSMRNRPNPGQLIVSTFFHENAWQADKAVEGDPITVAKGFSDVVVGPVRNFVFEAYFCPKENICLANRKPCRPSCRRFPPSCWSSSA